MQMSEIVRRSFPDTDFLTMTQLAQATGVSRDTIRRMIDAQVLPAFSYAGGHVRIYIGDIDQAFPRLEAA